MTSAVGKNLNQIKQQITKYAIIHHRNPAEIQLLAVSKTKPVTLIQQAIDNHHYRFGENYVQEGVTKIHYFKNNSPATKLEWHFIGTLQSNKTRLVAESFDWMQTLDNVKIAQRLHAQRPKEYVPLNVLIQINISDEKTKSGIIPDELLPFAQQIVTLSKIKLRGIMAIPDPHLDKKQQQFQYDKMFALYMQLKTKYPAVDTLSLGMSQDICAAIAAGSTMLRIGTAIFGNRNTTIQDSI